MIVFQNRYHTPLPQLHVVDLEFALVITDSSQHLTLGWGALTTAPARPNWVPSSVTDPDIFAMIGLLDSFSILFYFRVNFIGV